MLQVSHSVFHSYISLVLQNGALYGNGLTPQNVKLHLRFTLSAMLEHYRQQIARNLLPSLSYCRIKKYSLGLFSAVRVYN